MNDKKNENHAIPVIAMRVAVTAIIGISIVLIYWISVVIPITPDVLYVLIPTAFFLFFSISVYKALISQFENNRNKIEEEIAKIDADNNTDFTTKTMSTTYLKSKILLERNITQTKLLFWLLIGIIAIGFSFLAFGIYGLWKKPDTYIGHLSVISGTFVNLLGGTFIIIYKQLLQQSALHVTQLSQQNINMFSFSIVKSIEDNSARDRAIHELSVEMVRK